MATIALAGALASCSAERTFSCDSKAQCVRDGEVGECVEPGFCAFSDSSCGYLDLRWDSTAGAGFAGDCVVEDSLYANECGGRLIAPGAIGDPCGQCGALACGTDEFECQGELTTPFSPAEESLSSSSVKSGDFGAVNVLDGNTATSWMSIGPSGGPAWLSWTAAGETAICIGNVTMVGNGNHPTLSEDCGFDQVTISVLNDIDLVVEQTFELPGTPDPTTEAILGRRGNAVRLDFDGFEGTDCGGFAELTITGYQ